MTNPRRESFTAGEEDGGRRLDQVLAARVPGLSRRQARLLLDIGGVFVDGRRVKVASRPIRPGEEIVAVLGGALTRATKRLGREARAADERRLPPYAVVFEDEDVVVVDKPAGLLTAPTPESDRNNLADLLGRRGSGGRILVVHRIDLETSGLVVLAKTDLANRVLSARFRAHDLERAYLCVVSGAFPESVRRLSEPVGGRPATTHVGIDERIGQVATRLRCRLETGRTHQIRIHMAGAGHPVLGDGRYGRGGGLSRSGGQAPASVDPPRMALHATLLAFAHPRDGRLLSFESPWPPDLAPWMVELRAHARTRAGAAT